MKYIKYIAVFLGFLTPLWLSANSRNRPYLSLILVYLLFDLFHFPLSVDYSFQCAESTG